MRRIALLLALPAIVLAGDVTKENWRDWKKKIVPKEDELAFLTVGWRPTFFAAIEEAQEKDLPILLWAMNGHPLGCT